MRDLQDIEDLMVEKIELQQQLIAFQGIRKKTWRFITKKTRKSKSGLEYRLQPRIERLFCSKSNIWQSPFSKAVLDV